MFQKRLTKDQALQKLRHYCSYQERSHTEAKEKLYGFGLYKKEVEECLAQLIEENYLNEERFAIAYAGGKFRMRQWGRIKIRQALKEKRISDYCIQISLKEIDDQIYMSTLRKLALAKWKTLEEEKNIFIKQRKTQDYLLQKGYEHDLVAGELKKLKAGNFQATA